MMKIKMSNERKIRHMTHVNEEIQEKKPGIIVRFIKLDFKKKLQYLAVLLL